MSYVHTRSEEAVRLAACMAMTVYTTFLLYKQKGKLEFQGSYKFIIRTCD